MVKTSFSNSGDADLIPGCGAKILHASQSKNKSMKQKQNGNKFNKNFNDPLQKNLKRKYNSTGFNP